MKKTIVIVGAVALLAVSGLLASNMGFKLNYNLAGPGDAVARVDGGTSFNGTNPIALPFNPQTGITSAQALFDDIGSANVQNISKFVRSDNSYQTYAVSGTDFNLDTGIGYLVRMKVGLGKNYIIVGSHAPGVPISLPGAAQSLPEGGTSFNGSTLFAYPYHSMAANTDDLADDIGSADVQNIGVWIESTNTYTTYTPHGGSVHTLEPGVAYLVRIKSGVSPNYTPSHY